MKNQKVPDVWVPDTCKYCWLAHHAVRLALPATVLGLGGSTPAAPPNPAPACSARFVVPIPPGPFFDPVGTGILLCGLLPLPAPPSTMGLLFPVGTYGSSDSSGSCACGAPTASTYCICLAPYPLLPASLVCTYCLQQRPNHSTLQQFHPDIPPTLF